MGLRSKILNKIQNVLNRFSGEHSEAAPENRIPYERGTADDNVEVVMAKLNRPKAGPQK